MNRGQARRRIDAALLGMDNEHNGAIEQSVTGVPSRARRGWLTRTGTPTTKEGLRRRMKEVSISRYMREWDA